MLLKSIPAWAAFAAAVIVTACGGGGGGGIGGTGSPVVATSYGGVTAIGSVWVNGVEFDTSGVPVRDRSGAAVVPKAGMVVQVDGSIAEAKASAVTVEGSLRGPVEQVIDANHIVVMGQIVTIDDTTCGDGAWTDPRRPGCGTLTVPGSPDQVEVHGLIVSDGVIQGGLITQAAATPPFAVKGFVKNLTSTTFDIGPLQVNYAGVSLANVGGALSPGQLVEVKGSRCSGTPTCGTLTATTISTSGVRSIEGLLAEVEGFVTPAGATNRGFTVGTQPVSVNGSTVFVGGTIADVVAGAKVEVEGGIGAGVLNARRVRFQDSIRIEAVATRIGNTLTFAALPGVSATANAFTEYKAPLASVAGVSDGSFVNLRGRLAANHTVVMTRLEVVNSGGGGNRTSLQAPVEANNSTSLTLLGVAITPPAGASFKNLAGATLDRPAFFAAATASPPVLVKARYGSNGTPWNELELEED